MMERLALCFGGTHAGTGLCSLGTGSHLSL